MVRPWMPFPLAVNAPSVKMPGRSFLDVNMSRRQTPSIAHSVVDRVARWLALIM
jgi:hypothetical protein